MPQIEPLRFLSPDRVRSIAAEFGTPVYVYDEDTLRESARQVLNFPNAFGLTARFAMKANPNAAILRILTSTGLQIDASSGYEVERAMRAGVSPEKIMVSSQSLPHNLAEIVPLGVKINATSLHHLEQFGKRFPGGAVGLRFNPGLGSGGTNRTNVGGPASGFGIWYEQIEAAKAIAAHYKLRVLTIHTHIGSGSDPEVWQRAARLSIRLLDHFPDAVTLNLGGGFKVGRMSAEKTTDLQQVGAPVVEIFRDYARETGREIELQIEPGTFLAANMGCIIAEVSTLAHTGSDGYLFYKLNCGMTEILRPSLYGAQHPLTVVSHDASSEAHERPIVSAIVVGHCCESGDILTPLPADPEGLAPRALHEAKAGDLMVIGGAGAYCAAMSSKNYNSFPEAAEVLMTSDGTDVLIRRRQTLEQMLQNEISI